MKEKAYLEITMFITEENRMAAAKVYNDYREPFLREIKGALTKELLIRKEDVQVLHGFNNIQDAKNYLESNLFKSDVVTKLAPLFSKEPEIKIYEVVA
nr:hypothetical protein [uncultured Fusobacterium sp.]